MERQDWTRRFKKNIREKLGSRRPKDVSDYHSVESQKHQIEASPRSVTYVWKLDESLRTTEDNEGLVSCLKMLDLEDNWINRIRLLLERGADPNLAVGEYGTALQIACTVKSHSSYKERDMHRGAIRPKVLLEICPNINVNAQGGLFGSALQAAAYSGQTPTISLLLNRGAHVNARGGRYGSALNAAVIAGNWDIAQVLLDAGAIPDCMLPEPDEEWLQRVLEYDGQGGVERYIKFWEVEKAEKADMEALKD